MRFRSIFACLLFVFSVMNGAIAQNNMLPTVPENTPYIAYIHGAIVDGAYNSSTQVFSITGSPSAYYIPRQTGFCNPVTNPTCPTPSLSLTVQVDNNGNLIGGNPVAGQPDFELLGQITAGGVTYTSPLLTGTVSQFFYDGVNNTPNFDFRIAITGGSMAALYLNPPSLDNDLWMTLNLEAVLGVPDFNGSFASSWGGEVKGNVYGTPGQCFGTIGDFVWNDQNANGIQDAGEPGIDGVTVNLYDYQGNLLQSVVTSPGPTGSQLGYYQFTGICAGTYTVQVDNTTLPKNSNGQIGFVPTIVNAPGSTTANDSNPNPSSVILPSNDSSDETIDFGYIALQGAIGDYVWYDANRNGLQDTAENGINGVIVDLYDSTQTNLLAQTTTAYGGPNNVNGYYQFTGLSAGSYVVVVDAATLPPNYTPTTSFVGSNPAIDSNGSPAPVTLPSDSSVDETIDFGYVSPCNGIIGDFVWHDLNQNGIQDSGEPGISGVTLDLYDSTHTLIQTAITNGTGYYQFSGLCAGTYEVDVVGSTLPPNFTPTISQAPGSTTANDSNGSPAPVTLGIDSNNNVVSDLTIDFGYISPCNGAIGDFVWSDLNGNGIQDAGEPGIANVTVSLYNSQMTLLNATTTDQNGYYQFTGLCAATYIVQVTPPTGYLPTIVNAPGSTTANDSNPNPSTVNLTITDSNGDISIDETIDFGFVLPPSATCVSINAVVGNAITPVTMVGSGGSGGPYTFTATGLPAGLSISTAGVISGTPTVSGTFNYTVTVTDSAGNTGTINCSVTVAPPVSATCVAIVAVQGYAITPVTMVGSGGSGGPYTFTATGLPAGLSISSTGTISGTPTVSGTFSYTVTVTDSNGHTGTVNCSVTVA
ncbi:MAG: SdrD B-like domain-containing protein, partial [Terracidiphilus sp.]